MKNTFRLAVAFYALLAYSTSLYAADDKNPLRLDIKTTVQIGTCKAELQNTGGSLITSIAFGNVYKSELANKLKVQNFQLAFTNCVGLVRKQAKMTLEPTVPAGCAGPSANSANFANSLTGGSAASSVEVWMEQPDSGTALHCFNKPEQTINLSTATGATSKIVPLSARMAIAPGQTLADVTAGAFSTRATFVITYE